MGAPNVLTKNRKTCGGYFENHDGQNISDGLHQVGCMVVELDEF